VTPIAICVVTADGEQVVPFTWVGIQGEREAAAVQASGVGLAKFEGMFHPGKYRVVVRSSTRTNTLLDTTIAIGVGVYPTPVSLPGVLARAREATVDACSERPTFNWCEQLPRTFACE
jgi:hypothetical protein